MGAVYLAKCTKARSVQIIDSYTGQASIHDSRITIESISGRVCYPNLHQLADMSRGTLEYNNFIATCPAHQPFRVCLARPFTQDLNFLPNKNVRAALRPYVH